MAIWQTSTLLLATMSLSQTLLSAMEARSTIKSSSSKTVQWSYDKTPRPQCRMSLQITYDSQASRIRLILTSHTSSKTSFSSLKNSNVWSLSRTKQIPRWTPSLTPLTELRLKITIMTLRTWRTTLQICWSKKKVSRIFNQSAVRHRQSSSKMPLVLRIMDKSPQSIKSKPQAQFHPLIYPRRSFKVAAPQAIWI